MAEFMDDGFNALEGRIVRCNHDERRGPPQLTIYTWCQVFVSNPKAKRDREIAELRF